MGVLRDFLGWCTFSSHSEADPESWRFAPVMLYLLPCFLSKWGIGKCLCRYIANPQKYFVGRLISLERVMRISARYLSLHRLPCPKFFPRTSISDWGDYRDWVEFHVVSFRKKAHKHFQMKPYIWYNFYFNTRLINYLMIPPPSTPSSSNPCSLWKTILYFFRRSRAIHAWKASMNSFPRRTVIIRSSSTSSCRNRLLS